MMLLRLKSSFNGNGGSSGIWRKGQGGWEDGGGGGLAFQFLVYCLILVLAAKSIWQTEERTEGELEVSFSVQTC